jgi:hypothetical protein
VPVTGWDWLSHTALSRGAQWRPASAQPPADSRPGAQPAAAPGPRADSRRTTRDDDTRLQALTSSARRGAVLLPGDPSRPLIVVDEAHAFRNPAARRYRSLAEFCTGADVLLITATPVNNSALDFYHLLRLFACDDAFADIGVPDLRVAFGTLVHAGDAEDVRRVAEAVVVRRTRELVRRQQSPPGVTLPAATSASGVRLAFPRTRPVMRVRYGVRDGDAEAMREKLRIVARLRFPVHALQPAGGATELLRLSLLKRLESSTAAFAASVDRHATLLVQFVDAALDGFLLEPRDAHARHGAAGPAAVQLVLRAVSLSPWPATVDRVRALASARAELRRIRRLRELVRAMAGDAKADALRRLLMGPLRNDRVLVFSEYRDTAVHLWHRLAGLGGVALVHGAEARLGRGIAARNAVIRRFAPLSNGARPPPPHQQVRVLIATDVLAEGLNLQDARVVISYDLPWNPVRLAQRIGRIDRLGSPHEEVAAYAFLPDRGLDDLLGLLRRVRRKLRHIRAVGGDRPRFGTGEGAGAGADPADGAVSRGARAAPVAESGADLTPARASRLARETVDAGAAERLRAAWQEQLVEAAARSGGHCTPRRSRPPVRHGAGARTRDGAVPTAAMVRPGHGAALVCFTAGEVCWIMLVRRDGSVVRSGAEADHILLHALVADGVVEPDAAWLDEAARLGRAALREQRSVPASVARRRSERRAAALVQRWLSGRPGGASPDDCAAADAVLARLAAGLSATVQRRLDALAGAAAGTRATDADGAFRAISDALRDGREGAPPDRVQTRLSTVRLRAALDLQPG